MRCPLCVKAGVEHELHAQNAKPQPAGVPEEYWDKADRNHIHDPQRFPLVARCSNGHNFTVTFISRCPVRECDWNKNPEIDGVGWPKVDDGQG